jgi:hypothetical protein
MSTFRERIAEWAVTTLNTGTPAGVPAASRSYLFTIDADIADKAISVFLEKDQPLVRPVRMTPGLLMKRLLTLRVECRAKSTATTRPDQEVDAMAAWVVKALCGQSLGVSDAGGPLFHATVEGETSFAMDQRLHGYILATVEVAIEYQTKADDLEVWA